MREFSHVIGRIAWTVFLTAYFSCFAKGQAPPPNCETIAAPPPLATLGGPATAAPGNTELGIAVGAAGNIYPSPCGHEGFSDWLVRWRRGMNSRMDLGFDFEVDNHSGGGVGGTAKGAIRYQVKKGFRLEGGFGASDTGFAGGSLNADLAATIGTSNVDRTWNYYASLRLAGSHGCFRVSCLSVSGGHAPGALVPLGVVGAVARVSENVRFVLETGLGEILSREHPDPGGYLHFSFGVLFDVGKKRTRGKV